MGEIAAHPLPLVVPVPGGLVGPGVFVAEGDALVHEVADRAHPGPTRLHAAEQRPGDVGQLVRLAVAAAEQVDERPVGQVLHGKLGRLGHDGVRQAAIGDVELVDQLGAADGAHDAVADIAEIVAVGLLVEVRDGAQLGPGQQVLLARRMQAERQQHRHGLRAFMGDTKATADAHRW